MSTFFHDENESILCKPRSRARVWALRAWAIVIAAALGTGPLQAGGRVGNGTPGSCTEGALNVALVGGDLVTFDCGAAAHTITFNLTKVISAPKPTTIDGGGKITLATRGTVHFKVLFGRELKLTNIHLIQGKGSTAGAVENLGKTTVTGVTFADNASPDKGGAILNRGTLEVFKCTFENNSAVNGGGAIGNLGTLTVKTSTFTTNSTTSGGGALLNEADANVEESTFSGNAASFDGGAIFNRGKLTVDRCTLSGNQASQSGGGIHHSGSSMTLTASTLNGNAAQNGGGILASGSATYINNTLSGNQAAVLGGGLFHISGPATMRFTTIVGNFAVGGAGIFVEAHPESLELQNNLLASNTTGNCDGSMPVSLGNNLSSDTHCSAFTKPGDQQNVDPRLGPLAHNGGPTQTHQPQFGSPAIDAAVTVGGITTDQRGVTRPQPAKGKPDVGSVEVQQKP